MNKLYVTTLIILIISKDIYVVTIFRTIGIPRILLHCIIEKLVPEIDWKRVKRVDMVT